jgi:hypothetical protein
VKIQNPATTEVIEEIADDSSTQLLDAELAPAVRPHRFGLGAHGTT